MDLRLVGFERSIPLKTVHQLMPVAIIGFAINLVTGLGFFLAVPRMYAYNPPTQLAKAVGAVSLLTWFGALCFGRLLPYLGTSGG